MRNHTPEILNAVFICRRKEVRKVFFSEEKNFCYASPTLQAAPGSEFAKVFCFFSSEKKTLLPSLWRQMNTAFRISAAHIRIKHHAG